MPLEPDLPLPLYLDLMFSQAQSRSRRAASPPERTRLMAIGSVLDVAGIGLSAFGIGESISAERNLEAASQALTGCGYMSPWLSSDAAQAAARASTLGKTSAAFGGLSFALGNFLC